MTHPLRINDFRVFYIGRVVDSLGDAVAPLALALTVISLTRSAAVLSAVLTCALGARLLALPLGGALADRLSARRVALACDLVRGSVQALVGAYLIVAAHPSAYLLAAGAAVNGLAAGLSAPTGSPLVAATVGDGDPDARRKANALMGVARSVTSIVGPLVAGALLLTVGPGWAFVLDAGTFAVSAVTLTLIHVRPVGIPKRSLRVQLAEGWSEVRSRRWYWSTLIAHACWNFACGMFLTVGPFLAVTRLGGQAVWLAVQQAGAVGVLLGSLLAGRVRPRHPLLAANLALLVFALPLVSLAALAAPAVLIVANSLAFLALGYLNPIWDTAVQDRIPRAVLARVTAYDWLVSLGAMPLGYIAGPALADRHGAALPLVAAAVLVVVSALSTLLVREVRDLDREVAAPVEVSP